MSSGAAERLRSLGGAAGGQGVWLFAHFRNCIAENGSDEGRMDKRRVVAFPRSSSDERSLQKSTDLGLSAFLISALQSYVHVMYVALIKLFHSLCLSVSNVLCV